MAATVPAEPTDPELQETAWDLEPLVEGEGQEGVGRRLSDALGRASSFAERYAALIDRLARRLEDVALAAANAHSGARQCQLLRG